MIRREENHWHEWWNEQIEAIERKAKRNLVNTSCAVAFIAALVILFMYIGPYWVARAQQ